MPRCSQPRHGSLYLYANERTPLEKELGVNDSSNDNSRQPFPAWCGTKNETNPHWLHAIEHSHVLNSRGESPRTPRVARRKAKPIPRRRADSFPHDRFVDATADAEAVIGFGFLLVILALTVTASSVFSAN